MPPLMSAGTDEDAPHRAWWAQLRLARMLPRGIAVLTAVLALWCGAGINLDAALADLADEPIVTILMDHKTTCTPPCRFDTLGVGYFSGTGGPPDPPDDLPIPGPWSPSTEGWILGVALSPNGQTVAVSLWDAGELLWGDEKERILVMDADGSDQKTVWERETPLVECGESCHTWEMTYPGIGGFSPDGESLLLSWYASSTSDIGLLDLANLELTPLVSAEAPDYVEGGSWTVDGESFFYQRWEDSASEFVQSDLAGQQLWATEVSDEGGAMPRPSPDGTTLAYIGWDPVTELNNLYVMDIETETSTLVDENLTYLSLSWSPDGEDLVYTAWDVVDEYNRKRIVKQVPAAGGTPATVLASDVTYGPYAFALRSLSDLPAEDDGDAIVEAMAAEYFVGEYGGTTPEAVAWMDIQNRADGLDETLNAEMPAGSYGGMWFDNTARRVKVALTDDDYESDAEEILGRRGLDLDTEFEIVPASLGALSASQGSLETALADLIDDGLVSISTSAPDNRVEIVVGTSATSGQVAGITGEAAKAAVDTKILTATTGTVTAQPLSCEFPSCDPPLRGGVFIQSTNKDEDDDIAACTAGFIARSKADSKPYLMTAGHCFDNFEDDESAWEALIPGLVDGERIGPNHNPYKFGDDGDVGLISMEAGSFWRTPSVGGKIKPLIYVRDSGTGSTPQAPSYYIRRVGTSVEGRILCATGASEGSSCGEVTALDTSIKIGGIFGTGVPHLGKMRNCDPGPGDSGGPVFKRHVAYGVLVARRDCDVYFQSARRAENALNVKIVTRR